MIFQIHIAYSLEFLVLLGATALLLGAKRVEGCCRSFAKIVGVLVIALSLGSIICLTYFAVKYHRNGYFDKPLQVEVSGKLESAGGMGGGKMECPMMKQMMEKMKGDSGGEEASPEGHEGHH